jgi:hypothetical protein
MHWKLPTLCAALALLALPMAAQEAVDPTQAPRDQLMTITGTVVELREVEPREYRMVVDTVHGTRTFEIHRDRFAPGLEVGDQVRISYSRTQEDVLLVNEMSRIAPPEEVARLTTTGTVVEITNQELVLRTDVGLERFRVTDVRVPTTVRVGDRVTVDFTRTADEVMELRRVQVVTAEDPALLPATASTLPRLALFGLLALFAAMGLRWARA